MDHQEAQKVVDQAISRIQQEDLEMAYRHLMASISRPQKAIEYVPCEYCQEGGRDAPITGAGQEGRLVLQVDG